MSKVMTLAICGVGLFSLIGTVFNTKIMIELFPQAQERADRGDILPLAVLASASAIADLILLVAACTAFAFLSTT